MANVFDILNVSDNISKDEISGTQQGSKEINKNVSKGRKDDRKVETPRSSTSSRDGLDILPELPKTEKLLDSEIDTLKSFTIPKKNKTKKELFENVSPKSREHQELLGIITKSYKNKLSSKNFVYSRPVHVHNEELFKTLQAKKKFLRGEGYTDKDLSESYAFLCVDKEEKAKEICKAGVKKGNLDKSWLGNPEMAVSLCRNADILTPVEIPPGENYLIVFQVIKGKAKVMKEDVGNAVLDPTPNFDCHMAKSTDTSTLSQEHAFHSTQLYMYEYNEDFEISEQPPLLCPYAMTTLVATNTKKPASKPTPKRQISKPSIPAHSNPPVHAVQPQTHPISGSHPQDTSQIQVEVTPQLPSFFRTLMDCNNDDKAGCVVWTGDLCLGNTLIAQANLISYGLMFKPARMHQRLNICTRIALPSLTSKYFTNVANLDKRAECCNGIWYYNYCEMQSTHSKYNSFNKILTYLAKTQSAIIVRLEDDTDLVMLTNCELTQRLGLQDQTLNSVMLHCVFISPRSRHNCLQAPVRTSGEALNEASAENTGATSREQKPGFTPPAHSPLKKPDSTVTTDSVKSAFQPPAAQTGAVDIDERVQSYGDVDLRQMWQNPNSQAMDPMAADKDNGAVFKEPPKPTRVVDQLGTDHYDGGFRNLVSADSLIFAPKLKEAFKIQVILQDKRNMHIARQQFKNANSPLPRLSYYNKSPVKPGQKSPRGREPPILQKQMSSPGEGHVGHVAKKARVEPSPIEDPRPNFHHGHSGPITPPITPKVTSPGKHAPVYMTGMHTDQSPFRPSPSAEPNSPLAPSNIPVGLNIDQLPTSQRLRDPRLAHLHRSLPGGSTMTASTTTAITTATRANPNISPGPLQPSTHGDHQKIHPCTTGGLHNTEKQGANESHKHSRKSSHKKSSHKSSKSRDSSSESSRSSSSQRKHKKSSRDKTHSSHNSSRTAQSKTKENSDQDTPKIQLFDLDFFSDPRANVQPKYSRIRKTSTSKIEPKPVKGILKGSSNTEVKDKRDIENKDEMKEYLNATTEALNAGAKHIPSGSKSKHRSSKDGDHRHSDSHKHKSKDGSKKIKFKAWSQANKEREKTFESIGLAVPKSEMALLGKIPKKSRTTECESPMDHLDDPGDIDNIEVQSLHGSSSVSSGPPVLELMGQGSYSPRQAHNSPGRSSSPAVSAPPGVIHPEMANVENVEKTPTAGETSKATIPATNDNVPAEGGMVEDDVDELVGSTCGEDLTHNGLLDFISMLQIQLGDFSNETANNDPDLGDEKVFDKHQIIVGENFEDVKVAFDNTAPAPSHKGNDEDEKVMSCVIDVVHSKELLKCETETSDEIKHRIQILKSIHILTDHKPEPPDTRELISVENGEATGNKENEVVEKEGVTVKSSCSSSSVSDSVSVTVGTSSTSTSISGVSSTQTSSHGIGHIQYEGRHKRRLGQRLHPYNRSLCSSSSESHRLRSYRPYRELKELFSNMSTRTYSQRRENANGEPDVPINDLKTEGRFKSYKFTRSTSNSIDDDGDIKERPEDVPEYSARRQRTQDLDRLMANSHGDNNERMFQSDLRTYEQEDMRTSSAAMLAHKQETRTGPKLLGSIEMKESANPVLKQIMQNLMGHVEDDEENTSPEPLRNQPSGGVTSQGHQGHNPNDDTYRALLRNAPAYNPTPIKQLESGTAPVLASEDQYIPEPLPLENMPDIAQVVQTEEYQPISFEEHIYQPGVSQIESYQPAGVESVADEYKPGQGEEKYTPTPVGELKVADSYVPSLIPSLNIVNPSATGDKKHEVDSQTETQREIPTEDSKENTPPRNKSVLITQNSESETPFRSPLKMSIILNVASPRKKKQKTRKTNMTVKNLSEVSSTRLSDPTEKVKQWLDGVILNDGPIQFDEIEDTIEIDRAAEKNMEGLDSKLETANTQVQKPKPKVGMFKLKPLSSLSKKYADKLKSSDAHQSPVHVPSMFDGENHEPYAPQPDPVTREDSTDNVESDNDDIIEPAQQQKTNKSDPDNVTDVSLPKVGHLQKLQLRGFGRFGRSKQEGPHDNSMNKPSDAIKETRPKLNKLNFVSSSSTSPSHSREQLQASLDEENAKAIEAIQMLGQGSPDPNKSLSEDEAASSVEPIRAAPRLGKLNLVKSSGLFSSSKSLVGDKKQVDSVLEKGMADKTGVGPKLGKLNFTSNFQSKDDTAAEVVKSVKSSRTEEQNKQKTVIPKEEVPRFGPKLGKLSFASRVQYKQNDDTKQQEVQDLTGLENPEQGHSTFGPRLGKLSFLSKSQSESVGHSLGKEPLSNSDKNDVSMSVTRKTNPNDVIPATGDTKDNGSKPASEKTMFGPKLGKLSFASKPFLKTTVDAPPKVLTEPVRDSQVKDSQLIEKVTFVPKLGKLNFTSRAHHESAKKEDSSEIDTQSPEQQVEANKTQQKIGQKNQESVHTESNKEKHIFCSKLGKLNFASKLLMKDSDSKSLSGSKEHDVSIDSGTTKSEFDPRHEKLAFTSKDDIKLNEEDSAAVETKSNDSHVTKKTTFGPKLGKLSFASRAHPRFSNCKQNTITPENLGDANGVEDKTAFDTKLQKLIHKSSETDVPQNELETDECMEEKEEKPVDQTFKPRLGALQLIKPSKHRTCNDSTGLGDTETEKFVIEQEVPTIAKPVEPKLSRLNLIKTAQRLDVKPNNLSDSFNEANTSPLNEDIPSETIEETASESLDQEVTVTVNTMSKLGKLNLISLSKKAPGTQQSAEKQATTPFGATLGTLSFMQQKSQKKPEIATAESQPLNKPGARSNEESTPTFKPKLGKLHFAKRSGPLVKPKDKQKSRTCESDVVENEDSEIENKAPSSKVFGPKLGRLSFVRSTPQDRKPGNGFSKSRSPLTITQEPVKILNQGLTKPVYVPQKYVDEHDLIYLKNHQKTGELAKHLPALSKLTVHYKRNVPFKNTVLDDWLFTKSCLTDRETRIALARRYVQEFFQNAQFDSPELCISSRLQNLKLLHDAYLIAPIPTTNVVVNMVVSQSKNGMDLASALRRHSQSANDEDQENQPETSEGGRANTATTVDDVLMNFQSELTSILTECGLETKPTDRKPEKESEKPQPKNTTDRTVDDAMKDFYGSLDGMLNSLLRPPRRDKPRKKIKKKPTESKAESTSMQKPERTTATVETVVPEKIAQKLTSEITRSKVVTKPKEKPSEDSVNTKCESHTDVQLEPVKSPKKKSDSKSESPIKEAYLFPIVPGIDVSKIHSTDVLPKVAEIPKSKSFDEDIDAEDDTDSDSSDSESDLSEPDDKKGDAIEPKTRNYRQREKSQDKKTKKHKKLKKHRKKEKKKKHKHRHKKKKIPTEKAEIDAMVAKSLGDMFGKTKVAKVPDLSLLSVDMTYSGVAPPTSLNNQDQNVKILKPEKDIIQDQKQEESIVDEEDSYCPFSPTASPERNKIEESVSFPKGTTSKYTESKTKPKYSDGELVKSQGIEKAKVDRKTEVMHSSRNDNSVKVTEPRKNEEPLQKSKKDPGKELIFTEKIKVTIQNTNARNDMNDTKTADETNKEPSKLIKPVQKKLLKLVDLGEEPESSRSRFTRQVSSEVTKNFFEKDSPPRANSGQEKNVQEKSQTTKYFSEEKTPPRATSKHAHIVEEKDSAASTKDGLQKKLLHEDTSKYEKENKQTDDVSYDTKGQATTEDQNKKHMRSPQQFIDMSKTTVLQASSDEKSNIGDFDSHKKRYRDDSPSQREDRDAFSQKRRFREEPPEPRDRDHSPRRRFHEEPPERYTRDTSPHRRRPREDTLDSRERHRDVSPRRRFREDVQDTRDKDIRENSPSRRRYRDDISPRRKPYRDDRYDSHRESQYEWNRDDRYEGHRDDWNRDGLYERSRDSRHERSRDDNRYKDEKYKRTERDFRDERDRRYRYEGSRRSTTKSESEKEIDIAMPAVPSGMQYYGYYSLSEKQPKQMYKCTSEFKSKMIRPTSCFHLALSVARKDIMQEVEKQQDPLKETIKERISEEADVSALQTQKQVGDTLQETGSNEEVNEYGSNSELSQQTTTSVDFTASSHMPVVNEYGTALESNLIEDDENINEYGTKVGTTLESKLTEDNQKINEYGTKINEVQDSEITKQSAQNENKDTSKMDEAVTSECKDQNKEEHLLTPNVKGPEDQQKEISSEGKKDDDKGNIFEIFQTAEVGPETTAPNTSSSKPEINDVLEIEAPNDDFDEEMETSHIAETESDSVQEDSASKKISGPTPEQLSKLQELVQSMAKPGPKTEQIEKEKKKTAAKKPSLLTKAFKQALMTKKQNVETARATAILKSIKERAKESVKAKVQPELQIKKPSVPIEDAYEAEAYENEEFEVAKPGALPKVSKPVILFKPPPMDLNNAKDVRERYHQALVNKEIIVPPIPEIGYHTNYENRQRQKMEEGDVLVLHDLFYKKKIVGKTGAIIDSDLTDITVVESLKLFVQFTGKICEDSDVVQQKNDFLNYVLSPFKDQTKKFNDSHLSALSPIVNSLYKNRKARKPSMKPSRKRKMRVLKQVKNVAISRQKKSEKIILPQLQSKAPQQVKDLAKPVIQDTHIPVSGVKDQKQVVDQVPKVKQQLPTEEHHIPTGIKPITEEQTQSGDLKHIETEVSMEKKVKLTEVPNESVKDIQSENTEKTTLEIKIANEEQLIKEQEELTLEQEELIARLTQKSIFLPTDSKGALPQVQSVEPSKRKQDDQFGDDRKKPKMDIPVDKSIESMNDDAVVPPLKPGLSRERSDSPKPKDRKRKKIEKMDEMSSKVIAGLVDEIDDEHHLESKQSTDDAKKRKMEEDSGTENLPKITEAKADVRMEVDALPDISKAVASRSPVKTANIPLPVPRAAELMQKSDALKQSESTVEQPKTMEPTNVDKPVSRWDKVTKKPIVLEIGKTTDLSKKPQIVEKIVAVKTKEKSASPEKEETSVSKIPQFIIQKVSQPVVNPGTIGCFPYPSASPATKEPKSDPAPNIPVPSYYDTSISGQYSTTLSYTTSAGAPSGEAVKPDSTSKTSTAKPFFIGKMKKFSSAKETADATKAGEKAETVAENEAPPPPPPEDKLDAPVPPIPEPPPPLPEDIPKPTQYSSKPVAYSSKPVAYTTSQSSVKPPEPPPAKIRLSTLDSATEEAVNQQAANAKAWQEYWKKQQDGTPASSSETEAGATPWTAEQQQWASQYGYDQYNQYSQGDQQGNWQNYWYGQGYNYPQGGSGYDQYSDPNQCQGGPPPGPWMGIEGHPPPPPFGAPPPPWGMPPPPWGQWGPPPPQGQWGEGYDNDYEQDHRPSGDWMPTAERMKDLKVTKVSPRDGTCMYVHNKDKAKCKSVHRFLLFMGAKDFDPYSPTLLKAIRKVEAIVLIHKDDKDLIHTVPNLVQLKQDPAIQFLSYNDVIDVKEKSYLPILEKGGIAMLDNEVLFSTPPESLQTLCDYFESQTWKEGTNWCIKVHAHTMLKLQKLKMDSNPAMAAANKHAEETLAIIKLYKDVGVVDIMVKHDCDKHRKSYLEAQDYLHCYTHIQNENIKIARHHILISDIDPSSVSGQMFLHNGIDVQTFSSFCKKYAKLDVLVLPQSVQGPCGVDHPLYRAAPLSSGTEQLLSPYTPDESSMAEALPLLPPGTSPPRDTPHLKPPPMRPPPKIPSLFEIRPQGSEMDTAQSDSPSQDSWHTGPRGPPQSQVSPHHSTRGPPGQESGEGRFNVPPPHGGHGSQVSPPGGSRPPPANGPRGPPPSHSDPWGPPLNQSGPRGPPPNQSVHRGPSPSQSGPRGPPSNQSGPRGPPPSQSGPPPSQSGPPPSQFGPRGPPPSELDHKGPPPSQYGPRGPSPKSLTGANMTPITPNVGPRGALSGGIRPQTSSLLKGATTEGPRLTPLASRGFKSMAKPAAKPYTPPVEEPKPVELEDPLDNLPPVQSMPTPPIRMKVSKGATMPFKLKFPFGNVEEEPLPPGIAPERQGTGGSMIPPPPKQHPFSSIKEVPPIRPTQEVETQGAEEQTKEVPQQASGEKKLESIQEKMLRMISK